MRFMVFVKASADSEAGVMPSQELFEAMGKYNEELVKAGVMLAGEGLHPTSRGARVFFNDNGERKVQNGPFPLNESLVAGFWIFNCKSMDEAIEWAKRAPNPMPGSQGEVEIRKFYEAEDFGDEFTPELREQEERLRKITAERAS